MAGKSVGRIALPLIRPTTFRHNNGFRSRLFNCGRQVAPPILCAIDPERDYSAMDRDMLHAFTLRMNVFLQPKRQRDEQHAYDHGISADYPD
jgi:hypothetical protein